MIDDISSDKQRFAQKRVVKPFPKVAICSYFFTFTRNLPAKWLWSQNENLESGTTRKCSRSAN